MRSRGQVEVVCSLAWVFALCGLGSLGASDVSAAPLGHQRADGGGPGDREDGRRPDHAAGHRAARLRGIPGSLSHRHWHYKGFVRYQLRSVSDLSLVRPDNKAGFCLSDPALAPDFCGSLNPGALTVEEGLTASVSDYYNPLLEGQYIDVADVPPGDYWLVHWVNASKEICESSYANNGAAVKIALAERERVHFGQAALPPGVAAAGGARPASDNAVPAARRLVDLPLLCVPRRVRAS